MTWKLKKFSYFFITISRQSNRPVVWFNKNLAQRLVYAYTLNPKFYDKYVEFGLNKTNLTTSTTKCHGDEPC